jgi:Ca-activated chloride channel family protein
MTLENSSYLWILLVIPLFLIVSCISHRKAGNWLYLFAHTRKRSLPWAVSALCLSLALGAVILALAEPMVQYTRTVFNRSGIDVAIGIDVSKSMLAEDESVPEEGKRLFSIPNRLNRARYFALNIINSLKGERVGIFMFASQGVSIIPLTNDYGYCQYLLKHFNDATIAIPGSDLSQAIRTGVSMFDTAPRNSVKSIILISDGEDISDDKTPVIDAARGAAAKGIAVYTVGVGMGQWVLIPVRDTLGTSIMDYYKDEDGTFLRTRLEQETLKGISSATAGAYLRARDERSEESIVTAILNRARSFEYTRTTEPAWFPLSPILLCAALLFLMLGLIAGR